MSQQLLTNLQVDELRMSLNGSAPQTVKCRLRGCQDDGEFFMRRQTRYGGIQEGLYCARHDDEFGTQNLKAWAKELGQMLVVQTDEEGQFVGVGA